MLDGCHGQRCAPAHRPQKESPGSEPTPGLLNDNLGSVLLSHARARSTIAAGGLNFRVRDGNGCTPSAITAKKWLPADRGR